MSAAIVADVLAYRVRPSSLTQAEHLQMLGTGFWILIASIQPLLLDYDCHLLIIDCVLQRKPDRYSSN